MRYFTNPTLLWRQTYDRLIILRPGDEECVVLQDTAISLWNCFTKPRSLSEASQMLADSYGVSAEHILKDVLPIVDALFDKGLLVEAE